MEKLQLDQELRFQQNATDFPNKCCGRSRGAAGGQKVIDQDNLFPALDRIDMQFHLGLAVLERILRALRFVGQTAFFPQRDETNSQVVGNGRAKKKSARIDPDDLVDLFAAALLEERLDRRPKKFSVAQNGSDVL